MKNNNTGFGEKTKKVTQASKFQLSTSYPQVAGLVVDLTN